MTLGLAFHKWTQQQEILRHVHNNRETSGALRWGVAQKEPISIPLQRSNVFVYITPDICIPFQFCIHCVLESSSTHSPACGEASGEAHMDSDINKRFYQGPDRRN